MENTQLSQNLEQLILYVDAFCYQKLYLRQSNCQFQTAVQFKMIGKEMFTLARTGEF